jgi:hypothetical protein
VSQRRQLDAAILHTHAAQSASRPLYSTVRHRLAASVTAKPTTHRRKLQRVDESE